MRGGLTFVCVLGGLSCCLSAAAAPKAGGSSSAERLALVGVTQIGDLAEAWLLDTRTGAKATVRPGQSAFGYRVQRVGGEQATLVRNGRPVTLRLGERRIPVQQVAGSRTEMRAAHPEPAKPTATAPPAVVTPPPVDPVAEPVRQTEPTAPVARNETPPPVVWLDPRWFYPQIYPGAPDAAWSGGRAADAAGMRPKNENLIPPQRLRVTGASADALPFGPGPHWNPQTSRRRGGDALQRGAANPQTRRRRMLLESPAPVPPTWPVYPYVPW